MRSREQRIEIATRLGYSSPEKTGWATIDRALRSVATKGGDSSYALDSEKGWKGGWTERSIKTALQPGTHLHSRLMSKIAKGTTVEVYWSPSAMPGKGESAKSSRFVRVRGENSIADATKKLMTDIGEKTGGKGFVAVGVDGMSGGGRAFTGFSRVDNVMQWSDDTGLWEFDQDWLWGLDELYETY